MRNVFCSQTAPATLAEAESGAALGFNMHDGLEDSSWEDASDHESDDEAERSAHHHLTASDAPAATVEALPALELAPPPTPTAWDVMASWLSPGGTLHRGVSSTAAHIA